MTRRALQAWATQAREVSLRPATTALALLRPSPRAVSTSTTLAQTLPACSSGRPLHPPRPTATAATYRRDVPGRQVRAPLAHRRPREARSLARDRHAAISKHFASWTGSVPSNPSATLRVGAAAPPPWTAAMTQSDERRGLTQGLLVAPPHRRTLWRTSWVEYDATEVGAALPLRRSCAATIPARRPACKAQAIAGAATALRSGRRTRLRRCP